MNHTFRVIRGMRKARSIPLALAAGAALVFAGDVSFASIPASNGTIHGCFNKQTHVLRVIDAAVGRCSGREGAISWNQQGPAGARGKRGPAGPAGLDGKDGATGPAGPQGLKGDTGPAGPIGPQGPQGLYGPEGLQGPKGNTGPMGPQGPKGDMGFTGPQGPQGPQGETGLTGATGPQGLQGPKGDTGDPGPAGGPKGDKGDPGPAGPKGDKGDTGPAGAQGPKGDTGLQGPKGDTGPAGVSGLQYVGPESKSLNPNCAAPGCLVTVSLACPTGTSAIGGGFQGSRLPNTVAIKSSYPQDGTAANGSHFSRWTVEATNSDIVAHAITLYAICAKAS